ncbi:MAG: signal recognition particle-docking protein FtsY [Promethearchaeati archaeon SRVP18_Atabeyarchaeia-1]
MFDKLKEAVGKFVSSIGKKELNEKRLDESLQDLQVMLVGNDVSLKVAEAICEDVKKKLLGGKVSLLENVRKIVLKALSDTITDILDQGGKVDIIKLADEKKKKGMPLIIMAVGINGTGKTITISKLAYLFKKKGLSCVLAASDTFRAGSIEQLEKHGEAIGARVIKHSYGADAASVAWDAVEHARAQHVNVVLIDTAGRMQTNKNLLDEMEKIHRVVKPDLVIFIGDALAGNDAVEQADKFNQKVQIDGSILTKVDADVKGGAAISITYVTKRPILFVGVGQSYGDLEAFEPKWFVQKIFGVGQK